MDDLKGKVVLGIAAHPDDLDFGAAGTIAKFVKAGATAYYLILTDGSKGSEDMTITSEQLVTTRHKEQLAAAKILGVQDVFFFDYTDGELENTPEIRKQVITKIRQLKPDIVFTTDPTFVYDANWGFINHPDHRNAGQIALDCIFPFARNSRTFPELLEEGHGPHKVRDIFLINFLAGTHYEDITETFDKKLKALKEHDSQHEEFDAVVERVTKRASSIGEKNNTKYAEAFVRIHIPH